MLFQICMTFLESVQLKKEICASIYVEPELFIFATLYRVSYRELENS